MLDYRARQYDPLTARWNGVDALAEQYHSTTGYGYVGGNPINAVDLDGRETLYLTSSGRFIDFSPDNLPDAIVFVEERNYLDFFYKRAAARKIGALHSDAVNKELRGYGIGYLVDGIEQLYYRGSSNTDKTGKLYYSYEELSAEQLGSLKYVHPAVNELGNYLFPITDANTSNGLMFKISNEKDVQGSLHMTEFGKNTGYPTAHYHANNNIDVYEYKLKPDGVLEPIGYGPSDLGPSDPGDIRRTGIIPPSPYYNIVVGKNEKNKPAMYFYNSEMKPEQVIAIPFDIFK